MSVDVRRVAAALRVLADAIENTPAPAGIPAEPTAAPAAPAKRGRGRPVKGEEAAAPAPAPAAVEADPFATTEVGTIATDPVLTAAPPPVATLEEVRAALTALKEATTQEIALSVLRAYGGAENLSSLPAAKYGFVVQVAKEKLAGAPKVAEADPFEVTTAPAAPAEPEKLPTIEEVKAVVVAAQKRTSTDAVQKVVMAHGGSAVDPTDSITKPSLRALPPKNYLACIAAINALPTTK